MTTPLDKFKDWLDAYGEPTGYSVSRGIWNEDDTQKKFISLWIESGRKPYSGIEYANIRMVVTGQRSKPEQAAQVETFTHDTMNAAIEHFRTECIADVQPMGNIMGPFYTEARRAWYEVNFQLIM